MDHKLVMLILIALMLVYFYVREEFGNDRSEISPPNIGRLAQVLGTLPSVKELNISTKTGGFAQAIAPSTNVIAPSTNVIATVPRKAPSKPQGEITSAQISGYKWNEATSRMGLIVEPTVDIRQTNAAEQAQSTRLAIEAARQTTAEMNSLAIMPAARTSRCGPKYGNKICGPGQCCNQMGFCGYSAANCMPGENIGFNGISFAIPAITSTKLSS